ncbi:MAG TPA: VOC family protein [Candidatus Baltobacteraceae bacterium]|nr:VOC family protein [Candidatus Baltobacteraceae bacterium]
MAAGLRFGIIINAESPVAVDDLVATVRKAGGTVTKGPVDAEFFEGRDAYFSDPEGNYWEIAWAASSNSVVEAARRAAGIGP